MKIISQDDYSAARVLNVLKSGGVVIVPTDTVYGIACDAENEEALAKIFAIKKRAAQKQIAWLVADLKMAGKYVQIELALEEKLVRAWPGAFTGIFSSRDGAYTIGLRVPNYPSVQKLIRDFGRPVAATSANLSGEEPITKIADIIKTFGSDARIDLIVDAGDLPDSMASTVVDFTATPPTVLRKGSINPSIFL